MYFLALITSILFKVPMQFKQYLLLASVMLQPAYAALLGDVQVSSALGERFNARINAVANDGDELDRHCFRLVATQDENVAHLRAHLSRGRLLNMDTFN